LSPFLSQLVTASDFRAVVGEIRRQQVSDIARAAAFIGALLLAWISLHPFIDLGNSQLRDAAMGNETITYLAFSGLAVLAVWLVMRDNVPGLVTLISPGFVLFGGWIGISVLLSSDPGTSMRRAFATILIAAVTASLMLLPKNQAELARWLSIAALGLLAICYLGILIVPHLSLHLASDLAEQQLAGDWRGSFGHKNVAAGMMAMLLFIGIYVVRSGAWISGAAIVALSSIFLVNTTGKSSLALCVAVLTLSSLTPHIRSLWLRAMIWLTPLVLLNVFTLGTVMSDTLAEIISRLPFDTSFTGRTDVWTFAVQALKLRLFTGYGFEAFWGGNEMRNLPEGMEWTATAAHSHNGYLDTALGIGLPGLALLIGVLVIAPLRNFHAADRGGNEGPLTMLLLRVWLFGLYLSSLESFFLDRADPLWFTFLMAVFGLHYLARYRLKAETI
jgi:O-antigen ligase